MAATAVRVDGYTSLTYDPPMIFIETPIFTARITELATDEEYAGFQALLRENPEAGAIIEGTGGLRKMRMKLPGRGKSAGARVIYYYVQSDSHVRMVFVFRKGEQDSLTVAQKKALKKAMEQWR